MRSIFSVIGLLLVMTAFNIQATEQRYVSDELFTYLHSGPGNNYRIIGSVNAGEPVQLLSSNSDTEFAEVIDAKGRTGWLPQKFLQNSPSLHTLYPALQTKLVQANDSISKLQKTQSSSQSEHQQQLETLNQQISELNQQLNDTQSKSKKIEKQNTLLRTELDQHDITQKMIWFRNGAMVFGAGLLLGLLLPFIIPRRKRNADRWMN